MASNCGPTKVMQLSNAVKKVPISGAVSLLQKSNRGYLYANFNDNICGTGVARCFSSKSDVYSPQGLVTCCGGVPLLGRSSRGRDGALKSMRGKASMSSWLQSSRILFIKGSGSDGNGDDTGFPSTTRRSRGKELGESEILRQEGHSIDEVPVAVIRSDSSAGKDRKGPQKNYVELAPEEEAAFIDGFSGYHTPQQVLKMLDTIPSQEVTPFVSFSILKKLFELENNFGFRNEGRSWINASENNSSTETFARLAIVTRLMDTILTCDNSHLLLDTLDLLRRECPHVNDHSQGIYDPENHLDYRNKMLQELLVRVTEGKLDLEQVCRAVVILGKMEIDKGFSFSRDFIDKFWVGIIDHSDEINSDNIVEVLRTVKYFKKSSRLVLSLAERKLYTLWWNMNIQTVAEICSIFISSDGPVVSAQEKASHAINSWQIPARLLMTLCKCTNLNIHKVTETELATIVQALTSLNFYDAAIEQALNKYMKAKCLKITDPQLVANIMDYAGKFRIRSTSILEAAAEFTVKNNGNNLSPPQLTSILKPFGDLDFEPSQGPRFWEVIENYLNQKFIQFPPKDIVNLLLACVYLTKHPLNFVDRTFSPYFLDRLHTSEPDFAVLQQHRSNLKLLDTALTLECRSKYPGPLLPKDFSSRTIFIDGRILRMTNVVKETLGEICKQSNIDSSVVLPCLPLNPMFTVDVLLTTPKIESENNRNSFLRSHINSHFLYTNPPEQKSFDLTTILVNIPEHYSSDGKFLIGPQSLRKRLLQSLGFQVVCLRYQTLIDAKGDSGLLREYIERKLNTVNFPR